MKSSLISIILSLIFLQVAEAQVITYLSENRFATSTVRTLVSDVDPIAFETETEAEAANGFGDFSPVFGNARQTSSLRFDSLTASGGVRGFGGDSSFFIGSQFGTGETSFEVSFDLSEPTTYSLDFFEGGFVEFGDFSITGPSLNIDEVVGVFRPSFGTLELSQSGVLDAGTYTIELSIETGTEGYGLPEGTFDLNLQIATVPEPSAVFPLFAIAILPLTKRVRV